MIYRFRAVADTYTSGDLKFKVNISRNKSSSNHYAYIEVGSEEHAKEIAEMFGVILNNKFQDKIQKHKDNHKAIYELQQANKLLLEEIRTEMGEWMKEHHKDFLI